MAVPRARVQDWPRAQEWAHIFLGGLCPPDPPSSRPGGLRDYRMYSIRYIKNSRCKRSIHHKLQEYLHTYPDSVTKSRPLVCGIRSVSSRQYDVNITFCFIDTTFALPSTNHRKKVDNRPIFRLSIYIIYISLLAPYWP